MRHLLILSVSAGAGHVRAAQAVEAAAKAAHVKATHIDLLKLVPRQFRELYGQQYIKLVEKLPELWSYLYSTSDRPSRGTWIGKLKRSIEKLNTRKLHAEIARLKPDAILCTHFLPAELLSRQKADGKDLPPLWVQVTDFDVHALWVHPHVDRYCVASDEVAYRLADRGVPHGRITVTGIPVMPQFSAPLERTECAAELGLNPEIFTALMMAGGAGVGALDELAARLLELPGNLQLIALAGRNAELLGKLKALARRHPARLFPLGFTTTVERVMTASDLVITKPGGLSVSECLAKGKPMLVVSPIPGQEERNADYLLESGAAVKAVDSATLEFKFARLMADAGRLREMGEAAHRIGKPDAARQVLALLSAPAVTRTFVTALATVALALTGGDVLAQAAENAAAPATAGATVAQAAARPANWAEPITLEGVPNLHRISPMLYRSEQPNALGMKNLEQLGIRTVINLRWFNNDDDEAEGTSLRTERVKILTWDVDDKHVIAVMRMIKDPANGPYLIHCQHGADRTGLMSAMYRVLEQGWTPEDALVELTGGGYGYHSMWKNILKYVRSADVEKLRAAIAAPGVTPVPPPR